jgi:DNA mismatch endonuclease Vsr
MSVIAPTLQAFFTDRLTRQLQASPRMIASYRDTMHLLLRFAQEQTGKAPCSLAWGDLDETLISSFLEHLGQQRQNSTRTRNLRLTAIRSLFKYAALRHPEHAELIARVLSIPPKRYEKRTITFLTAQEAEILIDAELSLRRALHRRGARYRLHARDIPGTPDLVIRSRKIAIFVDGDFWHGNAWRLRGLPDLAAMFPSRTDWWVRKITSNMERDERVTRQLIGDGWRVIRVWESEVLRDLDGVAERIMAEIRPRR